MPGLDAQSLSELGVRVGGAPVWPTPALIDAWRQAHHAAQLASEVGKAWGEPRADDSHSSFVWEDGALLGVAIRAPRPFRAALRVASLTLELVALDGVRLAARPLAGTTFEAARLWVRDGAARLAGGAARQPAVPAPDLPDHPVARGAAFAPGDGVAFAELARLLAAADAILRRIAAALPGAEPVRCWPHHFDLATLVALERDAAGDPLRTVGFGLAVPDRVCGDGYWYVSPWSAGPASNGAPPRALAHGRWVARGAAAPMAVLPLGELAAGANGCARAAALAGFLAAGYAQATATSRGPR